MIVNRTTSALPIVLLAAALCGSALAAPVPYTFSTGVLRSNGAFSPNGVPLTLDQQAVSNSIAAQLADTSVSGTFSYDNAAPSTNTTSGGAIGNRGTVYGAFGPTGARHSSYTSLSATVNGIPPRTITDALGFTIVGDDDVLLCFTSPCQTADFFSMNADNTTGTLRNLIGFTIGDYKVWNIRLFWQEGQLTPNLVPDFLNNANEPALDPLLAAPPTMTGRLAIDFVHNANLDGTGFQYAMFYDGLLVTAAIPEPQTSALLVAGLGLLGFVARRRRSG